MKGPIKEATCALNLEEIGKCFAEQSRTLETTLDAVALDLLVGHRSSVSADDTIESFLEQFERTGHDFFGVVKEQCLVGIASRAQISGLMSGRYGFALFARSPVHEHMMPEHLIVELGATIQEVLQKTLSRQGAAFHHDVALTDEKGHFVGMIPVRTLVQLQSQMVFERSMQVHAQHQELQQKNEELFKSLNELRRSKGRYETLFENSALGVALVNRQGRIDALNKRLCSLTRLSPEYVLTNTVLLQDFIAPDRRKSFISLLDIREKSGSGRQSGQDEFELVLPGGRRRLFRVTAEWIKETDQMAVLLDDISEQRELESRLVQNEKSLLLDALAGGIAHELNNKLTPILGYASLLRRCAEDCSDPKARHYAEVIEGSVVEAEGIIRQLLNLSRPPNTEMEVVDMTTIARESVDILTFQAREVNCSVALDCPAGEATVLGDPSQLKQVAINLILNALDAVRDEDCKEIRVSVQAESESVYLRVSDSGCGIQPTRISRVFSPFYTTKGPREGTGLGLTVCSSIVRLFGGDIEVERTSPDGSVFKVTLPQAMAAAPGTSAEQDGEKHPPASAGLKIGESASILVVDDEQPVARFFECSLKTLIGCEVQVACDGQEAIEALLEGEFDLIVSDVRMPRADGFELFSWVGKKQPGMLSRFIFVTGDAGGQALNERLNRLGVPVLRKPITPDRLGEACRETLAAAA